jgi:hypothetical protein
MKLSRSRITFLVALLVLTISSFTPGQTTEFRFEGDTGTAFSGILDMEFRVFNASVDGGQFGSAIFRPSVSVDAGKFSVVLDYGVTAFPVADRWIEVRTSPVGAGVYTVVSPRSKVISTPRAILANNAVSSDQLAGIDAAQFVQTSDPRMTNSRTPTAGSSNYIQNTTSVQSGANFNVAGAGTVGGTFTASIVKASTRFDLASNRILFAQGDNTFGGWLSGLSNTGWGNTAFGQAAAKSIVGGANNAMFGNQAGYNNVSGSENVMFGSLAGLNNTASFNSYLGFGAGRGTTSGERNVFVGYDSGYKNTTGIRNAIVGASAGTENLTGGSNSFFGYGAGFANTSGSNNTAIGANTNVGSNLTFATAIGSGASVTTSGTIVIGRPVDRVEIGGLLRVSLGAAGSNHVCRNSNFELSTCSSSEKYKSNIEPYGRGLDLIKGLRPVAFQWKQDGTLDFGLVAEEVNRAEPLLSEFNSKGDVEGVKYERLGVVLINAVKEQQAIIERQQRQIDELRLLVCKSNPRAAACN